MVRKQSKRRRYRAVRNRTTRIVRSARILGRFSKQLIMVLADSVAMPAAFWTALALRHGGLPAEMPGASTMYALSVLFTVPVFIRIGLYRAVVRFMGIRAAMTIGVGVGVATVGMLLVNAFVFSQRVPYEVFVIYFMLA